MDFLSRADCGRIDKLTMTRADARVMARIYRAVVFLSTTIIFNQSSTYQF